MFDFKEELKYYEPGLETVEETLTGDLNKDLVELMLVFLQARPDPLAAATAEEKPEEKPAEKPNDEEEKEPTEA